MAEATHISWRQDTESYTLRYVVPVAVRPLLGGRREITKSLKTEDKRLALRLARRMAAMLDRFTFDLLMTKQRSNSDGPGFSLIIKAIERVLNDGSTLRIEGAEVNNEEDRRMLAALIGAAAEPAKTPADERNIAALIVAYFTEGDRAKRWTAKTRSELEAILKLFVELMGADKPVADITRKDVAYAKDMLAKLPPNRSKDPRYREKTVLELAGMKIPQDDLLSVTSINKAMIRLSSLFKFGVQHGWTSHNPAEGMTIAKGKRDDEEREAMPDAEVVKLKEAVLRGLHDSARMKWLPLIGMYSGLRINEVAQLELSDFSEVDGIPVISVNADGEGKRLKNSNARRTVPVHPELIGLGLLEHVDGLRKRGAKRLFPDLPQGRDGYGQAASKWFARFREKLGLKHSYHSLRHSVASKLREADVAPEDVADLLGHSRGTGETTARYMKAASVKRLHEALSKLSYEENPPLRLVAGG